MAGRLKDSPFLEERLEVFREQLGKWNIDYQAAPFTLGSVQEFDPATERFVSGERVDAANALLTRSYRKGYEVKEQA